MTTEIICGDCLDVIKTIPEKCIDLVLTSPPYANQRQSFYSSIAEKDYPQWTVNWMQECIRVLKPRGSVAIVIRPHLYEGQISDYVLKTRLLLRENQWCECEELIWIKPTAPPFGSIKRPRRSWESILWFSRTPDPYCDPKGNGTPSSRIGLEASKGVGSYKHGISVPHEGIARCRDFVEVGTGESDRSKKNSHPAQFPQKLADWLIRLLCPDNGTVLDPFIGSGSTAAACLETGRNCIGIDVSEEYCDLSRNRLGCSKKS